MLDKYISAILDDIKDQFVLFNIENVPSVYIGGGTPSILGAFYMERLLAGLNVILKPLNSASLEFTVEANPESADADFLQACVEGGVNRISLGIQSFHEPSRLAVNRTGDYNLLDDRIAIAAKYFPDALSGDLIVGLPFQTASILENDINRLLSYNPVHVSLYNLVIEPQSPLGMRVSQIGAARLFLPSGEETDKLWIAGRDMLESRGFAQYEVSNFALPKKTCTHNIRYWRMENWLGVGPGASGTIINGQTGTGRRYTYHAYNETDIEAYIAAPLPRINSAQIEELNINDLARECLLMGFRYRQGPDPINFRQRFKCSIDDCIPKTINRWRDRCFFEAGQPGSLAPSKKGLLFLNSFLCDAFAEIENIRL